MPDLFSERALDAVLALQLTVAWAGEGLCEPPRLGWWQTDLVDELGGGDLLARLLPRTHRWAALATVRRAAVRADRKARLALARPDEVRTLFFWGFDTDEKLDDRLAWYQRGAIDPRSTTGSPGTSAVRSIRGRLCPSRSISAPASRAGRSRISCGPRPLSTSRSSTRWYPAGASCLPILPRISSSGAGGWRRPCCRSPTAIRCRSFGAGVKWQPPSPRRGPEAPRCGKSTPV